MFRKLGPKEGPPKITSVIHCADEDLKREPDVKLGYQLKTIWSTVENDNRCLEKDRIFDKIVA